MIILTESDLHKIVKESVNRVLNEEIYALPYDKPNDEIKRKEILNEITDFFKWIFGDDFELRAVSVQEGEILPIDGLSDAQIGRFFTDYLKKPTIFYNPFKKVLYSYKPEDDWYFKKVRTNAWGFKYIFYPLFVEDWGGWYNEYKFYLYEKEDGNLYHFVKKIE